MEHLSLKTLALVGLTALTLGGTALVATPAQAQVSSGYALDDDDDGFDRPRVQRRVIEDDDEHDFPRARHRAVVADDDEHGSPVQRRVVERRIIERHVVEPVVERQIVERRMIQPVIERFSQSLNAGSWWSVRSCGR